MSTFLNRVFLLALMFVNVQAARVRHGKASRSKATQAVLSTVHHVNLHKSGSPLELAPSSKAGSVHNATGNVTGQFNPLHHVNLHNAKSGSVLELAPSSKAGSIHNATGNVTGQFNPFSGLGLPAWIYTGYQLFKTARNHYHEAKEVYEKVIETGEIVHEVGHQLMMTKNWGEMANELVQSHSQAVDLLAHALDAEDEGSTEEAGMAMSHDEWALTKQVGELIHHADERCSKQLEVDWSKFAEEVEEEYDSILPDFLSVFKPMAKKALKKYKPEVSDDELKTAVVSIHAASQSYQAALNELRLKGFCSQLQANVTSYLETLSSEIQNWEATAKYSWHEYERDLKERRLRAIPVASQWIEGETMLDYVDVPEVPDECKIVHDKKSKSSLPLSSLESHVRQHMSAAALMLQDLANDCSHLEVSAWLKSSQAKQVAKCSTDLDDFMKFTREKREAQKAKDAKPGADSHQKVSFFDEHPDVKSWLPALITALLQFFERASPFLTKTIQSVMEGAPTIIEALEKTIMGASPKATEAKLEVEAAAAWVQGVAKMASRFADNVDVRSDCLDLAKFLDRTEE